MQDMLSVSPDLGAFISAPIKLAALISNRRRREPKQHLQVNKQKQQGTGEQPVSSPAAPEPLQRSHLLHPTAASTSQSLLQPASHWLTRQNLLLLLLLLIGWPPSEQHQVNGQHLTRHHAHYLDILPSAHFRYAEGRQLSAAASEQQALELEARSASSGPSSSSSQAEVGGAQVVQQVAPVVASSHIYKRSSALISSAPSSHYPQLVSSSIAGKQNPLSRRMMDEAAQHSRWTAPQMMTMISSNGELQVAEESQQVADLLPPPSLPSAIESEINNNSGEPIANKKPVNQKQPRRPQAEEAELMRQKQHIQYHDQWPSMAGKCHKRTLNFCASVLPFNTTTFPNIIGDTNRFEVKRSLPFFGFLAKSSCNKRLDELLCLLLEPPCSANSGLALPPCKKFCRLALEGCNEYIPATLAMSSVFDCRQYPDSNDPSVCINLAQGSKCAADEFKCPDKTCIPRTWLCDGVRDCIFAADEANCTALSGIGQQSSVCSTEEFKCDGKCVPKAWKCDGERDCLDGSDEEACDQRPRCGPDRFKCADGNGCLPKRWVCDGKAECRDGSDELNCELRECSENDFKCDNGICIPKLWRCDRQPDCKDASDERHCIYSNLTTSSSGSTTATAAPTILPTVTEPVTQYQQVAETSAPAALSISHHYAADSVAQVSANYYASNESPSPLPSQVQQVQQQQQARQQLESSLNDDISRIIQQESSSPSTSSSSSVSSSSPSSPTPPSSSSSSLPDMSETQPPMQLQQQLPASNSIQVTDLPVAPAGSSFQRQSSKELKKFDYDIIQSAPNLIQMNDLAVEPVANQQQQPSLSLQQQQQQQNQRQQKTAPQLIQTQIDFVPQQPVASQQTRQLVANAENQQPRGHSANRERAFGQVIKTKSGIGEPMIMVEQQQQQHHQQQQQQQRVPIYRSLFKTLKGGQARLVAAQNGGDHRYSMAVRRRRERHQLPASASTSQAPLISEEPSRVVVWTSSSASPDLSNPLPSSPVANNQTASLISSQQPQRATHGVASYLQLLNNRYNLRLPRVSPLPPARS